MSFFRVGKEVFQINLMTPPPFSLWGGGGSSGESPEHYIRLVFVFCFPLHQTLSMSSCMIFSWMSLLGGRGLERSDDDCNAPTIERRLELFEWVRGCRAKRARHYNHLATVSGLSTTDRSRFKLTPPRQVEFELVQAVTDYLGRRRRRTDGC
jgi:hypothetical protein